MCDKRKSQILFHCLTTPSRFQLVLYVQFLGSLGALVATHVVWIRHFNTTYHTIEYILGE